MNSSKYMKFIIPSLITVTVISFGLNTLKSNQKNEILNENKKLTDSKSIKTVPPSVSKDIKFTVTEDKNKFISTAEERLALISNRNNPSTYNQETISNAIKDPRIWDFSTEAATDNLPLDAIEKEDGRSFFNANPARVAISLPGDILEIALPDTGEPLLLEVKQAGALENGLVSLSGELKGETGTFNMTQGNNIIAGHINTSTNTFSFEVFGETGWIHESGALFTGELPPVVDNGDAIVHSSLGDHGEHIIAKGNNKAETTIDTHSHNDEKTVTNEQ